MKKVQKIKATYFPTVNYIGCSDWQYKITKYIYKKCPLLNYTSFWHDILYGNILHKAESLVNMFALKIAIDLIFLFMGFFGSMTRLDIKGMSTTLALYMILFFHTPFYVYKYLYQKDN